MITTLKVCDRCLCNSCNDKKCREQVCEVCELEEYPIENCNGYVGGE